jgi:tetratricopeptide (TPR) repeat protein
LLREAMEDMAEPDAQASAEIDAVATPAWQRALAQRMEAASAPVAPARVESRSGWLDWLRLPAWGYAVAATAMAAVVVGVFAWPAWQLHRVNDLTLEAYAEKRQIDFQLLGAPYAPIRRERGAATDRPAALAEAESIAASHADDPRWMAARGRIDLLAGDYPKAITGLEQALAKEPDSEAIQMDLAAAYYQRGQAVQAQSDFQKAYDLLSKVLTKDPQNRAALYNRAFAAAEMKERDKAVEDWNRYLQLDPSSGWAKSAREMLADIQKSQSRQ